MKIAECQKRGGELEIAAAPPREAMPGTNAVAKKAPAIRASEMAFSQINSGFHSRHAPCGMSVDMSMRSPIGVSTGLTATPSVRRDERSDHSGFREPRKRAAARRAVYRSHRNAPADDGSVASRRVGVRAVDHGGI